MNRTAVTTYIFMCLGIFTLFVILSGVDDLVWKLPYYIMIPVDLAGGIAGLFLIVFVFLIGRNNLREQEEKLKEGEQ